MMPSYEGRTANDITSTNVFHDAIGFCYRAVSWLDLAKRTNQFAAFHYACIDARLGIEHLMFEQLVLAGGNAFTREYYEKCLAKPRELEKMLLRVVPDYEKLQIFNQMLISLLPDAPQINRWNIKELRKSWGNLSSYLHWQGSPSDTTENINWQSSSIEQVDKIIAPIWDKMRTAHQGCMSPEDMTPKTRAIWERFSVDELDINQARNLLNGIASSK